MPNEATTTENAATVAEQGAPVAPTKAASKKGARGESPLYHLDGGEVVAEPKALRRRRGLK